ncbi:MAG: hypothetical protein A3F67_00895 [Verrucomicrobia bacterium RIFCSPHIGHO2_12_FULL_41_10]|nr:MAG: hypothetical protein A3F67_00895 [Verrucomicrobia bacterium RIFCSPHIGHO2_12_FULL_41_10]
MSNLEKYNYIRLGISKCGAFISAWETAFERQLSRALYNWIFDEYNYMYAAVCDGKIVAGLCIYPLDAVVNLNSSRVGLANNGFVVPSHRGKNLFVTLSKFALNDAAKNGLSLAYGISNKQALPGHKKVGWSVLPPLKFVEKQRVVDVVNNTVQWSQAPLSGIQRADIEACSRKSSLHRQFSILKTTRFTYWRYEARPEERYWFGFKYQDNILRGYCICKYFSEKKCLHFMDIDGDCSDVVMILMASAQSLDLPFERLNAWSLTAHCQLFLDQGYKEMAADHSFILIQPSELRGVDVVGEVNLVLGDNDVF